MTAEKYPIQLMVTGIHGSPVPYTEIEPKCEMYNPYILNDLDRAIKLAEHYQKKTDCPTSINIVNVLADNVINGDSNTPKFDYTGQEIMKYNNVSQMASDMESYNSLYQAIKVLVELFNHINKK